MDEKPIDHPGVPQKVYHTLGKRTFLIFLFERINAAAVFLLLTIALFVLQGQPFLKQTPAGDLSPYANLAALIACGLFLVVFAITFLVAWLIYTHYKFFLGDDALKI